MMTFHDCDDNEIPYDGSSLSWRVSAYAIVRSEQSEILLLKNRSEKFYDIPGGGVEMDESAQQALTREAIEEAGARIEIGELIHFVQDYFYHREQKKFYKTIQLFFSAKLIELGTPTDPRTEFVGLIGVDKLSEYPLPDAVLTTIEKFSLQ